MTVDLAFIGGAGWQFFDNSGNPLSGGKIYTYAAGTTTPLATYTSRDGLTANTNPIILDSAGRTPEQIWSTDGVFYKYVLKTATEVSLRTFDNIGSNAYSIIQSELTLLNAQVSAIDSTLEYQSTSLTRGGQPSAVASATPGNPNGTYYYRVTNVGPTGESAAGIPSSSVSAANVQINVTVPVSGDLTVTSRNLYRTAAGAADSVLGQLVGTILNNTTTSFVDNVADGALGVFAPDFDSSGGVFYLNGNPWLSGNSISTRLGTNANPSDVGYANTAIGANSLSTNVNGFRNTAVGVDAMQFNQTGSEMTAVGVHALGGNTTGRQSCAFGYGTLEYSNGTANSAFGTAAAANTTTAGNNSAFGAYALQLNTTGGSNTAVGVNAGYNLTTGVVNVCVGVQAGNTIGGGNFNTYVGGASGGNATTSFNAAVGYSSLGSLTTGAGNTAVGGSAGTSITTGNNNCFVGTNAGNNVLQKVDADTTIAIGFGAYTTKNNQCVIGTASISETLVYGVIRANTTYTVATLPSAVDMGAGARAFVTDATATTFASAVAGGGANDVPVYSNGTTWRIG